MDREKRGPASAGPKLSGDRTFIDSLIANTPTSVGVANTMTPATTARSGTYDDGPRRHNDCAWRDIGTTYAVEVAMPARTTTAGNGHGQLGPRLVKRRGRHCLSGGNTKKADSDEQSEGKYLGHSLLLWFWIVPPKYCANRIIVAFIAARRIQRRRKLSQLHEADKRMASFACGRS